MNSAPASACSILDAAPAGLRGCLPSGGRRAKVSATGMDRSQNALTSRRKMIFGSPRASRDFENFIRVGDRSSNSLGKKFFSTILSWSRFTSTRNQDRSAGGTFSCHGRRRPPVYPDHLSKTNPLPCNGGKLKVPATCVPRRICRAVESTLPRMWNPWLLRIHPHPR